MQQFMLSYDEMMKMALTINKIYVIYDLLSFIINANGFYNVDNCY